MVFAILKKPRSPTGSTLSSAFASLASTPSPRISRKPLAVLLLALLGYRWARSFLRATRPQPSTPDSLSSPQSASSSSRASSSRTFCSRCSSPPPSTPSFDPSTRWLLYHLASKMSGRTTTTLTRMSPFTPYAPSGPALASGRSHQRSRRAGLLLRQRPSLYLAYSPGNGPINGVASKPFSGVLLLPCHSRSLAHPRRSFATPAAHEWSRLLLVLLRQRALPPLPRSGVFPCDYNKLPGLSLLEPPSRLALPLERSSSRSR